MDFVAIETGLLEDLLLDPLLLLLFLFTVAATTTVDGGTETAVG